MEQLWILEIRLCPFIEVDTDGGLNFHHFKPFRQMVNFKKINTDRNKFLLFHLLWTFMEVVIRGGFSDQESLFSSFTLWLLKEVAAFRSFIHTETSLFHSLWLFREVVFKGYFNFEYIIFEFLIFRLWP